MYLSGGAVNNSYDAAPSTINARHNQCPAQSMPGTINVRHNQCPAQSMPGTINARHNQGGIGPQTINIRNRIRYRKMMRKSMEIRPFLMVLDVKTFPD